MENTTLEKGKKIAIKHKLSLGRDFKALFGEPSLSDCHCL